MKKVVVRAVSVILGVNHSHNGSVALIMNGEILSAIQAERISRIKRQALIPSSNDEILHECVIYCLTAAGLKFDDINSIAISTPWNVEKIPDNRLFENIGGVPKNYLGTFYVPHHFAHMEYIIHFGKLQPGIALVIDGSGSLEKDRNVLNFEEKNHPNLYSSTHPSGKEVISAYWFDGEHGNLIYRFSPSLSQAEKYNQEANGNLQSIGHYWRWASQYCCGSIHEAGKVMGLAAFGKAPINQSDKILSLNKDNFIQVDYKRLKEQYTQPNIFGLDISSIEHYEKLAAQVQNETEKTILDLLRFLKNQYSTNTLYLSGGVALNVVANEKIIGSRLFDNVILNGSVEDNGTAIGAALAVSFKFDNKRKFSRVTDYYGQNYDERQLLDSLKPFSFHYKLFSEEQILKKASKLLGKGKILGWFQGRSEFGPRALGNRSIFANPIGGSSKHLLDHLMKKRDRYRPYAPVVIEEEAGTYFNLDGISPVMMRNVRVKDKSLESITHVDGFARVQTVNKKDNPKLYSLLQHIKTQIGVPILLNTSFNLPGEPIVETPNDALLSFYNGTLDYLCLGNILVSRSKKGLADNPAEMGKQVRDDLT